VCECVSGSRFRVPGSGFIVQGVHGFRVKGSGFTVAPGFRVSGFGLRAWWRLGGTDTSMASTYAKCLPLAVNARPSPAYSSVTFPAWRGGERHETCDAEYLRRGEG